MPRTCCCASSSGFAEQDTALSANWIRSRQGSDGSWDNYFDGPGDVSTTVEAYLALRLAGDSTDAVHMQAAARFIRQRGGLEQARVFTHFWLALFGLWPWSQIPALPPELSLLPPWCPLNIYDFAAWARQTVMALTIVRHYEPVTPLRLSLDELHTGLTREHRERPLSRRWLFRQADRIFRGAERRRLVPGWLRCLALARAEAWIVARQEQDGSWGGIQPPTVYSLIALRLRGYALSHPVLAEGVRGLERFTIRQGHSRRVEASQSPVWDTAFSIVALADAGVPADDPTLRRAARWLLDQEVRRPGDWSVRRPKLEPSGWAFEFANQNYPDTDDTAEVLLALRRVRLPDEQRVREAIERGVAWLEGMRSKSGGWGAYDVDNSRQLMREIPFLDFGEVIDPPSADVTAHIVELLAKEGRPVEPSVTWLLRQQHPHGPWFGRWGVNYLYGTGAVVSALIQAGLPAGHPTIRRAVNWLTEVQNDDGGWGEDIRSYHDDSWIGKGPSTASQASWALLALLATGERESQAVARGVRFLIETQQPDGNWAERQFTATGFPSAFYLNYHLYRPHFPVTALARFAQQLPVK